MNNLLREKGNGLQLRIRSFRCEPEDFPFRLKFSFNFMQVNLTNRDEAILFLNIIWRVKCTNVLFHSVLRKITQAKPNYVLTAHVIS